MLTIHFFYPVGEAEFRWRYARWPLVLRSSATCFLSGCALRVGRESQLRQVLLPPLAPRALLLALAAFVVVVALTRYVSLGSIVAAASFPVFFYLTAPAVRTNYAVIFFMVVSSLLIIIRHKDNIRRLLAGTENRLGKSA